MGTGARSVQAVVMCPSRLFSPFTSGTWTPFRRPAVPCPIRVRFYPTASRVLLRFAFSPQLAVLPCLPPAAVLLVRPHTYSISLLPIWRCGTWRTTFAFAAAFTLAAAGWTELVSAGFAALFHPATTFLAVCSPTGSLPLQRTCTAPPRIYLHTILHLGTCAAEYSCCCAFTRVVLRWFSS